MTRWSSGRSMLRIALCLAISLLVLPILASGNQLSSSGVDAEDMTQGVISYYYDITDGSESAAPRLQATLQFNESADIDEVIFILRSSAGTSGLSRVAIFSANDIGSNVWKLDEPLNSMVNGSYEYYLNFAYKSGGNGSDFNGLSSKPSDGKRWSNLISAFAAQDAGFLSQADPVVTFSNSKADTENPYFSHYLSLTDSSQRYDLAEEAVQITGNDGDVSTPIIVKLKAVFSERISYANDYLYAYTETTGSYTSYGDASVQIEGGVVTYTWTFDSKAAVYRLRPYLVAFDSGLNRVSIRPDFRFENTIADTSQPTLSSISVSSRLGDKQEKYIDYDLQFDAADIGTSNLREIGLTFRGPNCDVIYTRLHDYNSDNDKESGRYKGSWRILDNRPFGIYRISSALYIHDQQLNKRYHSADELIDEFSIKRFSFQERVNGQLIPAPTIYCPTYSSGNKFSDVIFADNSSAVVASYENTIQDGEGNTVTPRFGLVGDDASLFNISTLGVITFKSPPDFDNPLDTDADNIYELETLIYSSDSSDATYVSDDNHKIGDPFTVTVYADTDSDGVADPLDAFPNDSSESQDSDYDGVGDNSDLFPDDPTESLDTDSDGVGNNADDDDDGDGVVDDQDTFPLDSSETTDSDSDGVGDNGDIFPNDSSEWLDTDLDGSGNNSDIDDDNDGTADQFDAFPVDSLEAFDNDSDGVGDNADTDDDNDGVLDSEDIFPFVDYKTALLDSDLVLSPFGIVGFDSSAVEDPSIILGFTTNNFSLSALGFYLQSGKPTTLGVWSKIDKGYSLSETVDSTKVYPTLKNDIASTFNEEGYKNINYSGLESSQTLAVQYELMFRITHKFAVIEKGAETWELAYETVTDEYVTNAGYPIAIDTNKPIRTSTSNIGTYTILSPNREIPSFTSSELIGTWMIGGINEDDLTLSPRCKKESNDGNVCADLVTLNADGTGSTQMSGRGLNWTVLNDGSLRLSFTDNNTVFSVRQIEKNAETISTLVSGVANGKYFARTQLMVKQQDTVPQLDDLLLGETLASGFYVTNPQYLRSSIDDRLIQFFGFVLNSDNTGTRIYGGVSSTVTDVNGVSVVTAVTNYNREITWSYDSDDARKLVSKLCYGYNPLPDNFDWDNCDLLQTRTWNIVRATSTRLYVLETIQIDQDTTGDGVLDSNSYVITRPNFYEVRTYDVNDVDGDGYIDDIDVFPVDATEWLDFDGDGVGDNADTDDDNDGVADGSDAFPLDATETLDTDSDGTGNNADADDDGDGFPDGSDAFPLDPAEQLDTDLDGVGNNADTDDDGDGISDGSDAFPLDATESLDTDSDGTGNNVDPDDDNDGVADQFDQFPRDSTEISDNDADGIGDNADADDDNDGILDVEDIFPTVNYNLGLLDSDLSASPYGIIEYKKGAVADPSVELGYISKSFSLSPLGFYFESGKSTSLGNWSRVASGYLLSETSSSSVGYRIFNSEAPYYQNINWAALGINPGDSLPGSGQMQLINRNLHRLAVVEKGTDIWKLAYQMVRQTYATNTFYDFAINKNLPIQIDEGEIIQFDILAPDRAIIPFELSELVGTWMIGGIVEDDVNLASDCLISDFSCSDLITFNADGSALALKSGRALTWTVQPDGTVRISFSDNGSVFSIRQIDKKSETSSVLLSGAVNGKYLAQIQLMIKRQDPIPAASDLLLDKYLLNGFTITSTASVRSPVDNKEVNFFGFILFEAGTGKRVSVTLPDESIGLPDGQISSLDITWSYAAGTLTSESCYYTLPNAVGDNVCAQRQLRTWDLISVTDTRMYVLETLEISRDEDLDGVYEEIFYLFNRPNFYEWHSTFSLEDLDRDGVLNDDDLFPYDGADWEDFDGDGVGNNTDNDDDGDGVVDVLDAFPLNSSESLDTDNDGVGNNADSDDDNDGVPDAWTTAQLGSDIDGDAGDIAGRLALSGDGTVLAVGSWGWDSYTGFVRIFKWNASSRDWIQQGSAIYGNNQYDYTGYSISLSNDGSVVAIDSSGGTPTNEAGYVQVFAWDGQDWAQRGNNISGESAGDACCYLSLAGDGATIAVGAQRSAGSSNLVDSGQTRVFSWDGVDWIQEGSSIDGEAANDRSGRWATRISSDGLSVAVGARMNDGNGTESGHVRVYKWVNSDWVQRGKDIDGELAGDLSGNSVSLSSNGNIVAIGAPGNDGVGDGAGHVRVFGWNNTTLSWIQRGQDIDGQQSTCVDGASYTDSDGDGITDTCGEESGWASYLSSDGSTLAIGAWKNDNNGTDSGQTRVYGWDEPSQLWVRKGAYIDGKAAGDHSGYQTSVSSDGSVFATGAWGDKGADVGGYVRVFSLTSPNDAFPLDATESVDTDSDGIGNNADTDDDGDGVDDSSDAFPLISLGGLTDTDADGIPNDCDATCVATGMTADADDDNDTVLDGDDTFPLDAMESIDTDSDGIGNNADTDDDGDGVDDSSDAFPLISLGGLTDTDADGIPNECDANCVATGMTADADDDNDTVLDGDDMFPLDVAESIDTDSDGVGNNTDTDDDNDTVLDGNDAFPLDATESVDTDSDGIGNNADTDDDADGVADESDAFPLISLDGLTDTDSDGMPNDCDANCLATGMTADTDDDGDGVYDSSDAFPLISLGGLTDTDADGIPNECDANCVATGMTADVDDDGDGVADESDAFPLISLGGLTDTDGDGIPNDCDPACLTTGMAADTDDDGDDVADEFDAFPLISLDGRPDTDGDGRPNQCDANCLVTGMTADLDDDDDGILDEFDNYPLISLGGRLDTDGDGRPNDCDATCLSTGMTADMDDDDDRILDVDDAFPLDATESVDTDSDGIGNNADTDDDGDGVLDEDDAFPLDLMESIDTDLDGMGNNEDTDDDNDGVLDNEDAFPLDISENLDTDLDGLGNNADIDDDGDGVLDEDDAFPLDAAESIDTDGDGFGNNEDIDDDNDGTEDEFDAFPLDSTEISDNDSDGIGDFADADDDNDGVLDADDTFPLDASESVDTDSDGIGNNADDDDDGDGVADVNDSSPLDPTNDSDGDGIANNEDTYPENSLYSRDSDLDGMPDAWEILYGLDPNDPKDASSDRDNDGVSALDEFLAGTIPSGSIDLDGNEKYDALTDGLLLLRGMFGLDGDALITGTIASDANYTESADIESRIETLGDLADIDGNGQIDALTDGLLTLRYLFGLEGDTLINGVVAGDATRTSAEEIEAHLETLVPVL